MELIVYRHSSEATIKGPEWIRQASRPYNLEQVWRDPGMRTT